MASSSRTAKLLAGGVAAVILLLGLVYAVGRTVRYESTASLLLVPTVTDSDVLPGVLESFTRSATANTYVELIASADTLQRAGSPPVDVTVRAIPESRVIQVRAEGAEDAVVPGLEALIRATQEREKSLRDLWELERLEQPTEPEATSAPAAYLLIGAVLLALLGAGIVLVSLRRFSSVGVEAPPVIETRDDRTRQPVGAGGPPVRR